MRILLALLLALPLVAQTKINLARQSNTIDFTLLSPTKPFSMGASLPGTCVQGSMFFKTGVTNGQNLYGCPATNTWALEGGNAGGGVWGAITGTLSNQPDLQTALNGLVSLTGSYSDPAWITGLAWTKILSPPAVTGLSVVTALGTPGTDTNVATEAAVRAAITAAASGVTGPGTTTTGYLPAWGNTAGTSLGVGLPVSATPGANTVVETGSGSKIAAGFIPAPTGSALGGVEAIDCSAMGQLVEKINTDGSVTCATPGSSGTTIAFALNGTVQGNQPELNFIAGTGIVQSCVNNVGASRVDCTPSYNSALIPTHDVIHGNENYCKSTNGTTAYTCKMPNKALVAYAEGQEFLLNADATCASSCTLNVDGAGTKTITRADGLTAPGGALVAGRPQPVWYDGNIFRLVNE